MKIYASVIFIPMIYWRGTSLLITRTLPFKHCVFIRSRSCSTMDDHLDVSNPSPSRSDPGIRHTWESPKNEEDSMTSNFHHLKLGDHSTKSDFFPPCTSTKTGIIYDDTMLNHKCLWDEKYPESPARLKSVYDRIKDLGLFDRCHELKARSASKEEILRIHTEDHYTSMAATAGETDLEVLEKKSSKHDAIYYHPTTFDCALLAAGSSIELVNAMLEDKIRNGFALVRPPGHHAFDDAPCGYCFFNNVAIAAAHAVKVHKLERILIVDWDVHHGQATQFSFQEDEKVLYFSIHKYLNGTTWPELPESNFNHIGLGPGAGFNINVPLNAEKLTDYDYLAIFHNILLPIAHEFNPQLILVSAGFDAAIGCPEGNMRLSPQVYAHLTHMLMSFAKGKVGLILEGGYCLSSLAESAALSLRTLLGDPCPRLPYPVERIDPSVVSTILDVIWALQPYWKSVKIQKLWDPKKSPSKKVHIPDLSSTKNLPPQPPPEGYPTRDCYPVWSESEAKEFETEIKRLKDMTISDFPQKSTCLMNHPIMNKHLNLTAEEKILQHPESPARTLEIMKRLREEELVDQCLLLDQPIPATDEQLLLAHSLDHLERMNLTETLPQIELDSLSRCFDSVYFCQSTNQAAKTAAGGLIQVTDAVLGGQVRNGFAIIRPPGHHASEKAPAGFCIYNNIVIAARHAIKKYNLKKVLIVDWDVHHGDGTQSLVDNDPEITFISLHKYENGTFYPCVEESGHRTFSERIINIPWNYGTMSDADYLLAFFNIILPIAYELDPEVVFISSGFDAAIDDPLGGYELSPEVYGHFTHLLKSLANGKIIMALEGGYDTHSISLAAANCVSVLLGNPPKPLNITSMNERSLKTIRTVYRHHAPRRKLLQFGVRLPKNPLPQTISSSE
ncbi:histone deacetylase 6 isoform X2 [Brevipalpus obovatus]|uniref:histone deacetylase 6 isoform X2 n=2 Tax=Brevipalpus obovatus TaxID=246614 RepID=UPI003D9DC165